MTNLSIKLCNLFLQWYDYFSPNHFRSKQLLYSIQFYKCVIEKLRLREYKRSWPHLTSLSPTVCFLALISGGLGRWRVPLCYWMRPFLCTRSITPSLAHRRGTEVNGSSFLCSPVLTGLLQNREAQTRNVLRHSVLYLQNTKPGQRIR